MRIHVSFIDRVGITQEVLALLGGRNLNLIVIVIGLIRLSLGGGII